MSTDVIPNKCLQYIINIVHICYFYIKIIFFCPFLNAYYSYKIKRIFQPTYGDAYYTQGLTLHETSWYIFILLVWKKKHCYTKVLSMHFIEEFMNHLDSTPFLLELSKKILLFSLWILVNNLNCINDNYSDYM